MSIALVGLSWSGSGMTQDDQDVDLDQDDTADIDAQSTVDTAEATRDFVLRGYFRPLLNYVDIEDRSGGGANDTAAQARIRLRGSLGVAKGIQFGARVAGRCSTDDCNPEWVWDCAIPQSNGLADGQFTFDELYVHFFRREKFNLTAGRQQTRFVLRGGVFSRSLARKREILDAFVRLTWQFDFFEAQRRRSRRSLRCYEFCANSV